METHQQGIIVDFIPVCPLCSATLTLLEDSHERRWFDCVTCHTLVMVPAVAWAVARHQRHAKWPRKPAQLPIEAEGNRQ